MKQLLFIFSLLCCSILSGASTNIQTHVTGDVLWQSGDGAPDHSAPQSSVYSDRTNHILYCNDDGSTSWHAVSMVLVAEGSTAVVDDTDTTVHTFTIADIETTLASVNLTEDVVVEIFPGSTASALSSGTASYSLKKTATADQYELHIRHKDSGAANRTFKWKIYKR